MFRIGGGVLLILAVFYDKLTALVILEVIWWYLRIFNIFCGVLVALLYFVGFAILTCYFGCFVYGFECLCGYGLLYFG